MSVHIPIGVYIYRVQVRHSEDYTVYDLASKELGSVLRKTYAAFCRKMGEPLEDQATNRRWYVDAHKANGNAVDAVIQYGRTGFSSRLVDQKTRGFRYSRETTDLEIIPLFNKFWVPDSGNYGLWLFQSFSGYSCNSLMIQSFSDYWRYGNDDKRLSVAAVVPEEIKKFRQAPVHAVVLKTKTGGADIADRQLGQNTEDARISLEIGAPPKQDFGMLGEMFARFRGEASDKSLEMDGLQFEDAYARAKINNRTRTFRLTGLSQRSTLIDISSDVEANPATGHPTYESARSVFGDLVQDLAIEIDG